MKPIEPIAWSDGQLRIIDQTLLPTEYRVISLDTADAVWEAIKQLRVRGAPAIGVCAAFGVVVAVKEQHPGDGAAARQAAMNAADYLATSRPTAVNLFWALERMKRAAESIHVSAPAADVIARLETEAMEILEEDQRLGRAIGEHGAPLIHEGYGVLTHCNAGGLATTGYGTALAVMFHAHEAGTRFTAYADETRPLMQGARLTAWELQQVGIPVTVLCDNMAGQVMKEGRIQLVVTGADRIAANGDTANKIGTYSVAVLAKAHGIPFYIAAPYSTYDPAVASGDAIPIEERDPTEVTHGFAKQTAPDGVDVYNPAFDVTPAELIAGYITERGILRAKDLGNLAAAS